MQDRQPLHLTPLGGLQRWISRAMIAAAVCEVGYLYISLRLARFVDERDSGAFAEEVLLQRADDLDRTMNVVGLSYIAVYLVAFILGGVWIYRAARNAAIIAPLRDRISPGWAVGWHFIPFANLFKPYQAIREVYNSSISPDRPIDTPLPKLFLIWWLAFLLSNGLGTLSGEIADSGSPRALSHAFTIDVVMFPIALIALWLWHIIVLAISNAQDRGITPIPEISSINPGSPQGGING